MHPPSRIHQRGTQRIDAVTALIASALVALLVVAGNGRAPLTDAAPPPSGGFAHGAAGSGRNGIGGSIAPSPTVQSWPGTGVSGNGGPFSFVGAHYGSMWQVPKSANNAHGVGYCVMEDVGGEGTVALQPDPAVWDAGEMARAAALMSTFGGDRVVPYGIDASGGYDVASGEWQLTALFGGGEYTRRRHVAVNFGVKMFVEDVSPTGAVAGLKLARDTAVVDGSGSDFSALRNGYEVAQRLVQVAEAQHAVGGVDLEMRWATPDGTAPTQPGTHRLAVRVVDATGKPVGFVPVVALSDIGIGDARTRGAVATVDRTGHSPDEAGRWQAADALGWPTMDMAGQFTADRRFAVGANPLGADVTDRHGIVEFDVAITDTDWELAFHTQAPTADVALYAGTGIQGQITWSGPPQSASVHVADTPPPVPPPPAPTTTQPRVPPASTDPVVRDVVVRKVLDAPDVQGDRDMSGFEFEIADSDGTLLDRLTTGPDGTTQPFAATAGTHMLTEVGRPPWATGLDDGGPVTFDLEPEPDDRGDVHEVVYTNAVPDASISTAASDAGDGDQTVDIALGDATIVDTVRYTGLVPDTQYVVTGELMVRPASAASTPGTGAPDPNAADAVATGDVDGGSTVASSTVALVEMIGTGITASTTFVPTAADGAIDVRFEVPAASPLAGHTVVVYQQLAVASSRRVIAVHADPNAASQTIRFVDVVATTTVPDTLPEPPPPATAPPSAPPTSIVATNPPPATTSTTTTTTTAVPTPVTSPTGQLPRTGGDGSSSIAVTGLAIILLGWGLTLTTGRVPDRRRAADRAAVRGAAPGSSVRHQCDGATEADVGADRGDPAAWLHRVLRR